MTGYHIWGFIRQSLARAGIGCEKILWKLSGGKAPKALFSERANPVKIPTDVKIIRSDDYSTDIAKFDKDGNITDDDFVILTSTDFHYDEDTELNAKTTELFVRQIKDTKPDLIILTGDVILSKYQQVDAIKFADMMEKLGIYWTAVFGNHEVREEKGFYKWLLLKSFSDYDHCLVKHGPENLFGYGNHTINIIGKNGKLREALFLFDSGRDITEGTRKKYNLPDEMDSYDFLKNEQIDFYENEIKRLRNKYDNVDSMMYMHIPLCEYSHAFKGNEKEGFTPSGECRILYGEQYESVGCSKYNSGMFDKILELKSTKAVFAGHDHVNDWVAEYKGVYLVYSQAANYNPYHLGHKTDKPESEWMQGVTLTTIHPDGSLDFSQSLNSKYLKEN